MQFEVSTFKLQYDEPIRIFHRIKADSIAIVFGVTAPEKQNAKS